ncbi:MAG: sulfotransferase [Candidatus Aminicenantales bacterium]|jgi:hypothetical protein
MKTIILIGAGRSGSTVVCRSLAAHPKIVFGGETDFLAARLWNELWGNRFWFHWGLKSESGATSVVSRRDGISRINLRGETDLEIDEAVLREARMRAALAVRRALETIFEIRTRGREGEPAVWGFKELWNGSSLHRYAWEPYDEIFPGSVWVHLVRNPWIYVQSVSQWNRRPLREANLGYELAEWMRIVDYSRERKATGHYFEIRFEDVLTDPRSTLGPIFAAAGLEWDGRVLEPLQKPIMRSEARKGVVVTGNLTKDEARGVVDGIPGFREICRDLNYPVEPELADFFRTYEPSIQPSGWVMPSANKAALDRGAESLPMRNGS